MWRYIVWLQIYRRFGENSCTAFVRVYQGFSPRNSKSLPGWTELSQKAVSFLLICKREVPVQNRLSWLASGCFSQPLQANFCTVVGSRLATTCFLIPVISPHTLLSYLSTSVIKHALIHSRPVTFTQLFVCIWHLFRTLVMIGYILHMRYLTTALPNNLWTALTYSNLTTRLSNSDPNLPFYGHTK